MLFNPRKLELPTPDQALKGRTEQWFTLADDHVVLDAPVVTNADNIPEGFEFPELKVFREKNNSSFIQSL